MQKLKCKKIFVILFFALVLFTSTGCTVTYRLKINYDGTFDDSVVIHETKEEFKRLGYDMETYVEENVEINKKYNFYKDYYIKYLIEDDYARISGERDGWTLKQFNYSSLFIKSAFEKISVTNENDKLIFKTSGNKTNLLFQDPSHTPSFGFHSIDLIITSDYKVLESNADEINKFKNEYIWHFTPDNYDKEIYIEMDSKQTLLGQIGANIRNNLVGIIILLVVAVIAIVGGIFFYKKYQEVNGV